MAPSRWQKKGPQSWKNQAGQRFDAHGHYGRCWSSTWPKYTDSASPHEVTLVEPTLDETLTVGRPTRLIGDRAYDSDPLDQRLAARGISLIAPHRCNRTRPATQDGRALRRYKRRWKIKRLFAWLNKFKRVITRWDRCHERFTAFVHLACSMILLRRVQAFMK